MFVKTHLTKPFQETLLIILCSFKGYFLQFYSPINKNSIREIVTIMRKTKVRECFALHFTKWEKLLQTRLPLLLKGWEGRCSKAGNTLANFDIQFWLLGLMFCCSHLPLDNPSPCLPLINKHLLTYNCESVWGFMAVYFSFTKNYWTDLYERLLQYSSYTHSLLFIAITGVNTDRVSGKS